MTQPQDDKKGTLLKRSKDLIDSAVTGLKGRDVGQLVDEYTQEMTLVAVGLSQDLSLAQQELQQLSASHTVSEARQEDFAQQLKQLNRRMDALEKRSALPKDKRGLHAILRQITLIAAILAGAWVITALLKTFGG